VALLLLISAVPASMVCTAIWPPAARQQFAGQLVTATCAKRPQPAACGSGRPTDFLTQLVPPPPAELERDVTSGAGVFYSYAELDRALQAAGVPAAGARVGAAIAMAESHGASGAICDSCAGVREYSVGPWQLNLLAHPSISRGCAMELNCAARAASAISGRGSSWWAWTTFRTGAYRKFLA